MRRMTAWLRRQGDHVHHKRVARLRRTMGIAAIYPKPPLRQTPPAHRVYPYLLRGVPITRVNQVWSTDITDIRLHGGGYLLGGGDGLVQSVCPLVGGVDHDGRGLLSRSVRPSLGGSATGHLQP